MSEGKVIIDDPIIRRKKPCIIWDLDGVLADSDHRLHYIVADRANPDWESFHEHTLEDKPIKAGCTMFWAFDYFGLEQFICTARWNRNRTLTEQWLQMHRLTPYTGLFMRSEGDDRSGHEIKLDQLRLIWSLGYEPILAFDDNPEIVNMYRMSSVPCFAADDRHWHEETVQRIAREAKRVK